VISWRACCWFTVLLLQIYIFKDRDKDAGSVERRQSSCLHLTLFRIT
jgi:hypothetical protein